MPLSHSVHMLDAHAVRELPIRFRRGATYVAAASKTTKPYGFVHFEKINSFLYIDMLVTHPEYRNREWGKKLMGSCEAYGIAQQCTAAYLFVDEKNTKAHRFYSRLGYKITRYDANLRCYEMGKPLASPQPQPQPVSNL